MIADDTGQILEWLQARAHGTRTPPVEGVGVLAGKNILEKFAQAHGAGQGTISAAKVAAQFELFWRTGPLVAAQSPEAALEIGSIASHLLDKGGPRGTVTFLAHKEKPPGIGIDNVAHVAVAAGHTCLADENSPGNWGQQLGSEWNGTNLSHQAPTVRPIQPKATPCYVNSYNTSPEPNRSGDILPNGSPEGVSKVKQRETQSGIIPNPP